MTGNGQSTNQPGLYSRLYKRVDEFRVAGMVPDRIVVPSDDWRDVKSQANVLEGEGVAGGDKTLVNGVEVVYHDRLVRPRVIFEVDDDE